MSSHWATTSRCIAPTRFAVAAAAAADAAHAGGIRTDRFY